MVTSSSSSSHCDMFLRVLETVDDDPSDGLEAVSFRIVWGLVCCVMDAVVKGENASACKTCCANTISKILVWNCMVCLLFGALVVVAVVDVLLPC